jgi:hypothetical protein
VSGGIGSGRNFCSSAWGSSMGGFDESQMPFWPGGFGCSRPLGISWGNFLNTKKQIFEILLLVVSLISALVLKSNSSIWLFAISAVVYLVTSYLAQNEKLSPSEALEAEVKALKARVDGLITSKALGRL